MNENTVRLSDVFQSNYSDFLEFCSEAGKKYLSELTNVDFVAYRTSRGLSRSQINQIKDYINKHSTNHETVTNTNTEKPLNNSFSEKIKEKNNIKKYDDNKTTVLNTNKSIDTKKDSYVTLAEGLNIDANTFKNEKIESLLLSVRSRNALHRYGINSISQLLEKSFDELKHIKNLGEKSVNDIISQLKIYVSSKSNTSELPNDGNSIIHLSKSLNFVIYSFLSKKEYDTTELNEDELELFNRIEKSVEVVGREICLNAYSKPKSISRILKVLYSFSEKHIKRDQFYSKVIKLTDDLPMTIKKRSLLPFIHSYPYSSSTIKTNSDINKIINKLSETCSSVMLVKEFPELLKNNFSIEEISEEIFKKCIYDFLNWLNLDIPNMLSDLEEKLNNNVFSNSRNKMVFEKRLNGNTLDKIGAEIGVTRERIRQIEKKVKKSIQHVLYRSSYNLILLVYSMRDGDDVLYFNEVEQILGTFFAKLVWTVYSDVTHGGAYFYSKESNAFIIRFNSKTFGNSDLKEKLNIAIAEIPLIVPIDEFDNQVLYSSQKHDVPMELLKVELTKSYLKSELLYYKKNITFLMKCAFVLKKYYPAGFKISDEYEHKIFTDHLVENFEKKSGEITLRALSAKVSEVGYLCGRGKYIHSDFIDVPQNIIDSVNNYIEQSYRMVLSFDELFTALKPVFSDTWITDKYRLQGVLKKYGCNYKTTRDFVKKDDDLSFVDEIDRFIEERGIVHKTEIFAAFPGLSEIRLGQVVSRSETVFNIDNGNYLHASAFDIMPEDVVGMRAYLTEACKDIPVNIRSVYEDVMIRYPDFFSRNDFDDRNKLFAALSYMFAKEFAFSRPYIAKLGAESVTNRGVILQYISDYNSIDIYSLIDICDSNYINYISPNQLVNSLSPDFIRVDELTLIRISETEITKEIIDKTTQYLKSLLGINGYIVVEKFYDYIWLPEINMDWNAFLLESIVHLSGEFNTLMLSGDSYSVSNAVIVSDDFKDETLKSFIIKILTKKVKNKDFNSKREIKEWLLEEGLIYNKMPKYIESPQYFYVNEKGVFCTQEDE